MGNQQRKMSAGKEVNVQTITVSPIRQVKYSLEFSGRVMRLVENRKVRKMHLREARETLASPSYWKEWLENTMRDSIENELEEIPSITHFKIGQIPEVSSVNIYLDRGYKKSPFADEDIYTLISGKVEWTSAEVSMDSLKAAVDWRIGDRMAYYGLMNEIDLWMYVIRPGTLRLSDS